MTSLPFTPHILIIEDDPAIASTLQFALERENWQTTWLDTVNQVKPFLQTTEQLSVIIMDVGLPDGDGFSLCQQIRFGDCHQHIPILFLTARDDELDKIIGLEMGADDYITKPFSPREIIARVKAMLRREQMHQASHQLETATNLGKDFHKTLNSGEWQYLDDVCHLTWQNQVLNLSKTELSIMLTLLNNPSRILSREQILATISDFPEHRLARTIDSHVKTLRQKLAEIQPDCEVIITHRGLGYSLS
ncbi:response regulator [Faucicola boevrei]|uniref:response regulator n=1 Tax=Faucicola boevrei TaxID=346665 RepID=UPI00036BF7D9|nr:response regulator [Moraxella boevrei]